MGWKLSFIRIRSIVLEHISFDSPRAIAINLAVIILLLAMMPTTALTKAPSFCVFKNIILPNTFRDGCPDSGIFKGCECPACGLTRSVSRLLHGDINGSISYNRMGIMVLLMMAYLLITNSLKAFRTQGKFDKPR